MQATEILNVSRPFPIKLFEDGSIPHRKFGKHRRVRMEDVMLYKAAIDLKREALLNQLAPTLKNRTWAIARNEPVQGAVRCERPL